MFDLKGGWNISFAGCGFLGMYYVGVSSCFLEKAPQLCSGATRICGASSGALMASVLALGMPVAQCCDNLLLLSREARRRQLGPLHPNFNLLKIVRDLLQRDIPEDAHVRASGRLCVSLTRAQDGRNVLVSQFDSRQELIQALICSCFIPVYCGLMPPAFRGERYLDGALSNNLPQTELRNTISVSPFSGESDVCPRDNFPNFHEVRLHNVSIQFSEENVDRVTKVFFPSEPEVMAVMCQNGYRDALRFLKENDLLAPPGPSPGLSTDEAQYSKSTRCCEMESEQSVSAEMKSAKDKLLRRLNIGHKQQRQQDHWWLDEQILENLPTPIKRLLCQACREKHGLYAQVKEALPVRVASFMLLPCTLPVESVFSAAQRLVEWIPDVPDDMRWMYSVASEVYQQLWKGAEQQSDSESPTHAALTAQDSRRWFWDAALPPTPPPSPTPFTEEASTQDESQIHTSVGV